jgi:hypothetical protein
MRSHLKAGWGGVGREESVSMEYVEGFKKNIITCQGYLEVEL